MHVRLVVCIIALLCAVCSSIFQDCLDEPCLCNGGAINCTCYNREDIHIGKLTDPSIFSLEIQGCGSVHIELRAFSHTVLEGLDIRDVNELRVTPMAFLGANHLQHIKISHVANFEPSPHSFYGLQNVTQVFLTNLTSERFPEGFLYLQDVTFLVMTELKVKVFEADAIRLDLGAFLILQNSSIDHMERNSVYSPGYLTNMYLLNNKLNFIEHRAFNINFIENFVTNSCFVDTLEKEFFHATEVQNVWFDLCTINVAESGSLSSIQPTHHLWVKSNTFNYARNSSLPWQLKNGTISIGDNIFHCDCDGLGWILEPEYKAYQETSTCRKIMEGDFVQTPFAQSGLCGEPIITSTMTQKQHTMTQKQHTMSSRSLPDYVTDGFDYNNSVDAEPIKGSSGSKLNALHIMIFGTLIVVWK